MGGFFSSIGRVGSTFQFIGSFFIALIMIGSGISSLMYLKKLKNEETDPIYIEKCKKDPKCWTCQSDPKCKGRVNKLYLIIGIVFIISGVLAPIFSYIWMRAVHRNSGLATYAGFRDVF